MVLTVAVVQPSGVQVTLLLLNFKFLFNWSVVPEITPARLGRASRVGFPGTSMALMVRDTCTGRTPFLSRYRQSAAISGGSRIFGRGGGGRRPRVGWARHDVLDSSIAGRKAHSTFSHRLYLLSASLAHCIRPAASNCSS